MVKSIRRIHAPALKAKVALDALKEVKTIAELSNYYSVHATQITKWKKQALAILTQGFAEKHKRKENDDKVLIQELYRQIGQLKVEIDFLKKKMGLFEQ